MIYQIYYSEQTKAILDPGFEALNNSENQRPDWREYWPIRKFLLENKLNDGEFYGFFSPKFEQKTKLTANDVIGFSQSAGKDTDIILFSPFPDQLAIFLNLSQQGEASHPGFLSLMLLVVQALNIDIDPAKIVQHSRNSVFCNYFLAKPPFWKKWLNLCEKIFVLAESDSPLSAALNNNTSHDDSAAPFKVFIIERMASLIIFLDVRLNVVAYNPLALPLDWPKLEAYRHELMLLDALKVAFTVTGFQPYIKSYVVERNKLLNRMNVIR